MSGQLGSYTMGGNGGSNGSDPTPLQREFEANLKIQLDSIKKIQDRQTELYSDLEVLGANKNISDKGVQDQISGIFKQIETLNNVKNSIFQSLLTSYELNQSQLNASRFAYADSITALQIIEENLNNKQKILNDALAIRDNSERMVGINTYYTRRYEEHSVVLKYIVLFCGIIILAIFLMKIGIINNTISSIIIIASLAVGIIIIGAKVWDLSRRSNIDYDQYNFKFNPNKAPPNTSNTTNVKTDMTYGTNIFGNICSSIAKGAASVEKDIKTAVGDTSGTNTSASTTTTGATTTGATTTGATTTPSPASTAMGTGAAGNVESFILKNHRNRYNQGYNTGGCPLASNDTNYNYSDYAAY
jgi:hypothetical protein